MATTLEGVSAQIKGLRDLLDANHTQHMQQFVQLCGRLDIMNGRQRENTADISANREAVGKLSTHVDLAVDSTLDAARSDANRKSLAVGLFGLIQSLVAFALGQK